MDLVKKSDAEILAVADPIMDNLMDASTAIDYERHVRDFTDRARSVLSGTYCEQSVRTIKAPRGSSQSVSSSRSLDVLSP